MMTPTDEKIAVGDTVRFKMGGSAMGVEAIEEDESELQPLLTAK